MPENGQLFKELQQKKHLPFEKHLDFHLFSPKTRQQKKFDVRKLQPWSIMTLSMQLMNKQKDPANVFLENER